MADRTGDGISDATDDALLAAVHDEVIDYGVRRATATSIAKRAGVSRMTVYRRGGGVKQLVLDALSREFDTLLRQAFVEATASPGGAAARGTDAPGIPPALRTASGTDAPGIPAVRDQLAAAVVVGVRALAGSTLVHALLRHDPELLVPYLVDRHGESQLALRPLCDASHRGGHRRPLDPRGRAAPAGDRAAACHAGVRGVDRHSPSRPRRSQPRR
ncbi:MAG: TetR/AcrR family transcriptional regulator [Actinomycetales bacterium]|nr:TetR/AcrR family transcriptional regulator [Actinomycetales bacterium]